MKLSEHDWNTHPLIFPYSLCRNCGRQVHREALNQQKPCVPDGGIWLINDGNITQQEWDSWLGKVERKIISLIIQAKNLLEKVKQNE